MISNPAQISPIPSPLPIGIPRPDREEDRTPIGKPPLAGVSDPRRFDEENRNRGVLQLPTVSGPGAQTPLPATPREPGVYNAYRSTTGIGRQGVGGGQFGAFAGLPQLYSSSPRLLLRDFRYGIYTRVKRDSRPPGAMSDVKNFVPNIRFGSMTQRFGYTSAGYSLNLTALGGEVISSPKYFAPMITKSPSSQAIDIFLGTDGVSKYFFQKNFLHSNAFNTNHVRMGETDATRTISGAPSGSTFTLSGGSATDDYYKNWIVLNSTRSEYLLITGYNGTTKVVTTLQQIPSDWANTDAVTLYRHFHDNPTFSPTYNDSGSGVDGIILQQGNGILISGGAGSAVGLKPILSNQINKTFFSGATRSFSFQETYIAEAEVKSTNGIALANVSEVAASDTGLDTSARWFIAFYIEQDDGQKSQLIKPSTDFLTPSAATKALQTTITIDPALLNKRARYIGVVLGRTTNLSATTLTYSEYRYVTKYSLTDNTFTYNASGVAPGNYTKVVTMSITEWNQQGALASEVLNRSLANNTTVSFSLAAFVNNILFVGNFYDYTAGVIYGDKIRYSNFDGAGIPNLNVLPDLDEFTQSTVESGDPSSITSLTKFESKLFITKENSCYYVDISSDDSTLWGLQTVSVRIGSLSGNTVTVTPYGIVFASGGDDVYLWLGGFPRGLTQNWVTDGIITGFKDLSTTFQAEWFGWYDNNMKSYNLMATTDGSTKTTFYSFFFQVPIGDQFAIFKQTLAHGVERVAIRYDGRVYFHPENSIPYYFDMAGLTDAGTAISTSFDTGDYVVNGEEFLTQWLMSFVAIDQDASATIAGTLDYKIFINGSSAQTVSGLTKTLNFFRKPSPMTGNIGRRIRFQWNTNGSPATWTKSAATSTDLTIHTVGFETKALDLYGDKTVT